MTDKEINEQLADWNKEKELGLKVYQIDSLTEFITTGLKVLIAPIKPLTETERNAIIESLKPTSLGSRLLVLHAEDKMPPPLEYIKNTDEIE